MRVTLALLAPLLLAATPVAAQRAPTPALLNVTSPAPRFAAPARDAATPWDSLSRGQRDLHRALWATGAGAVGFVAGGALGYLLVRGDSRSADLREMDGLGVLALAAAGQTIGVTLGAASPGGRGHRACRGDVRLLRSLGGTLGGTAASALLASRGPAAAVVFIPVSQIAGAVLALGGC